MASRAPLWRLSLGYHGCSHRVLHGSDARAMGFAMGYEELVNGGDIHGVVGDISIELGEWSD